MLSTSGCSQLGLCSHGVGGQPLCLPTTLGVLDACLPAHCHALSAGPGTRQDNRGLVIACKTLRLKLVELPRNKHVLPSPEGTDRKTSEHFLSTGFAQRRLVELSPQAAKHVRAQPVWSWECLLLHRDALLQVFLSSDSHLLFPVPGWDYA